MLDAKVGIIRSDVARAFSGVNEAFISAEPYEPFRRKDARLGFEVNESELNL